MQRTSCLVIVGLLLAGSLAAQESRALAFGDLVTLLSSGVAEADIEEAVRARGLAFPATPAARRGLAAHGASQELIEVLMPLQPLAGVQTLEGLGHAVALRSGWARVKRAEGAGFEYTDTEGRRIGLITFSRTGIPTALLRDEDPKRRTLEAYLDVRADIYTKRHGYVRSDVELIAGTGVTGALVRLERKKEEARDPEIFVDAIFPLDAQTLLGARLAISPVNPTRARSINDDFLAMLAGLTPAWPGGLSPEVPRTARIAALLVGSGPEDRRLVLLDREGTEVQELARGAITDLVADPLAHHLSWRIDGRVVTLGPRGRDERVGGRDGPALWHPVSGRQDLAVSGPDDRPTWTANERSAAYAIGSDPLMDPGGRYSWFGAAIEPAGTLALHRIDHQKQLIETANAPFFRPASRLEVIADPGSRALLAIVSGTYFPLPLPGEGDARSVTRLLFVGPEPDVKRPLLHRVRPGADRPTWRQPRFTPSGNEIIVIDDRDRLMLIDRRGGLPLRLSREKVVSAAPWIAPQS